jgi:hypothetical protein
VVENEVVGDALVLVRVRVLVHEKLVEQLFAAEEGDCSM